MHVHTLLCTLSIHINVQSYVMHILVYDFFSEFMRLLLYTAYDLPTGVVSTQQEQQQQKQRKQSKSATPSTPSSASSSSSFFSPSPLSLGKPRKLYPKLKVSRDKVHISSPVLVEKKTGLTKAKSLEDLLGSPGSRESSPQRLGSPQSERKGSPGRVPVFPPIPTATSVGKGTTGHTSSDLKSRVKSKSGGKVKTGRAGKRHSEIQVPHHVLQSSCSPPRGPSPEHRGVTHTTSVPIPPPIPHNGPSVKETSSSLHLKTYVALSSYQSQVANSLSFQAGDKCVLLRMTQDGWWLVNIGGREGWTPEAYWREEAWVSNIIYMYEKICYADLYLTRAMILVQGLSCFHMGSPARLLCA